LNTFSKTKKHFPYCQVGIPKLYKRVTAKAYGLLRCISEIIKCEKRLANVYTEVANDG